MGWREWAREVEFEPSLYAANFAILGAQIEELIAAGCRIFHFDVGDGHFVEPVTMGPIVLQSISPIVHRHGGAIDSSTTGPIVMGSTKWPSPTSKWKMRHPARRSSSTCSPRRAKSAA